MKLLNVVELEKENGYCSVEIFHGDITQIRFPVDLLIVSAFKESYAPTPGTVIAALYHNLSVDLEELSYQEKLDFRETLNCWITSRFKRKFFKYIMVLEMRSLFSSEISLRKIFRNMFITLSIMNQMDMGIKTIAMPVLGTGSQRLEFEKTIRGLLIELNKHLKRNSFIERILFVEHSQEKSNGLSISLDKVLKRVTVDLPVDDVISGLKEEIIKVLQSKASKELKASQTYRFLKDKFNDQNARSIEYGIACRRLTEKLLKEMYFTNKKYADLSFYSKIQKMNDMKIASWIISYLHVIRIFGNESAHELGSDKQVPKSIEPRDLTLLLFCVQRIVEFWAQNMENKSLK